jgi:hypothetical protein
MERYEVVGTRAVDGHRPGETYEDTYPAAKIAHLVEAGHIRIVAANAAELRKAAAGAGIEGVDDLKKADLLEALAAHGPPQETAATETKPGGAKKAPSVVKEG